MKQYQKVLADLLSPNIRSIHIVSQGPFHGLPWQYASSVPETAFYPGLHAFWQRRHSYHPDQTVYPSEDCPLCLLSNGCDDDPQNRLYFLPVEIEMISLIWGRAGLKRQSLYLTKMVSHGFYFYWVTVPFIMVMPSFA